MESSEMKRDKEWLKNEIEIMGSETSENYPHDQVVDREVVLNLIDQLDEPVKVVIPRFVADWYESNKDDLELEIYATALSVREKPYDKYTVFEKWFNKNDGNEPIETIVKMKLNGYEIEKEKMYYVIIPTKDTVWKYYYLDHDGGIDMENNLKYVHLHTEAFIRSVSDDLWPFAVEVAE